MLIKTGCEPSAATKAHFDRYVNRVRRDFVLSLAIARLPEATWEDQTAEESAIEAEDLPINA